MRDHILLPRDPVASPSLTRPNWLTSPERPVGPLWVDKNENLDPELLAFTAKILRSLDPMALCTYPECGPLYKKLSEKFDIPGEHFILSAGSDGAIRYVFEAYVNPGDVVVHTAPTFAMYPVYAAMYGAKTVPLEYQPSQDGPLLTVDDVISTLKRARPKLFCLPNPDSPSGTIFPPDELEAIVRCTWDVGSVALIDEAYFPFYSQTALQWTRKYPHLVIARTFAKAWGLAGLRIGFAAASPSLAQYLHKVRPMYETNTVGVVFMEKMLDHEDQMLASVQRLNEGKAYFIAQMRHLGFRTLRNEGNFLHVAFGRHYEAITQKLDGKVLYRKNFKEPCLAGFSRFSSTTKTLFEPVVRMIEEVVTPNLSREKDRVTEITY